MLPQEIKAKTSLYSAETNELVEQPVMDKPDYNDFGETFYVAFEAKLFEYNAHIASLRRIPCDPSCKGLWKDQQKVVEGKGYRVKKRCSPQKYCNVNGCDYCVDTAFPLPLAEDELTELAALIKDEAGLIITNYPVLMDKLKNNWIIQKR